LEKNARSREFETIPQKTLNHKIRIFKIKVKNALAFLKGGEARKILKKNLIFFQDFAIFL
jgi:hypothetical protein